MDAIEDWIRELLTGNQQTSIKVSDLMSFPVTTIQERSSMDKAASLLRETGCTGVPVVGEKEKIVGIISRRDFQKKVKKESQLSAPVKAFMSTHVLTIDPGKSPTHASGLMIKHDIGRLPVVENDRIIGIVTRSDIMRYWYDLVPE
jgi:CBS domain-containing protein